MLLEIQRTFPTEHADLNQIVHLAVGLDSLLVDGELVRRDLESHLPQAVVRSVD